MTFRTFLLGGLLLVAACSAPSASVPTPAFNKRAEGRSGMVASSHPDATAAGLEILQAGGNAVDAGVAVAFALAVVDPSQTGLGAGGGLLVWHRGARRADAIDFYARTGSDSAWAQADSAAARQPINARSAGIPGAVAGLLQAHAQWGRLPRARVLAPAIRLAEAGFVVSPLLARTTESARAKLGADPAAARLFLPDSQPVRPGDRLVQPELAQTLQVLAQEGAEAFYRGPLAERAVAKLRSLGSPVTLADWEGYRPAPKRPVCTTWFGYTLLTVPPSLGGTTVLEALNLLAAVRADTLGSPTLQGPAALALLGAMRVASADRSRWRGDPAVFGVPARGMVSPQYAAAQAPLLAIDPSDSLPEAGDPWSADTVEASPACTRLEAYGASPLGRGRSAPAPSRRGFPDEASFTSHFSVVDGDRNAVAVTFTVGVVFGSGVYVNGYFLNSGGGNFDGGTRGPSRFANSTIAPTIALEGDDVRLVIGAGGSQYIPTAVSQVAWRALVLGEDPWLAIAAPRLQPARGKVVEVENGFAPGVYDALSRRGYRPVSRIGDLMFGGIHAVVATRNGRLIGVADPRRDGTAAGW